jgi:hypothetical protein
MEPYMNTSISEDFLSLQNRIRSMISADRGVNAYPLHEALTYSLEWTDNYVGGHCFKNAGMTEAAALTLAAARLEWLLYECMRGLNGLVTVDDFSVLCNTIQGDIATPGDFRLEAMVAGEFGLDVDTYRESEHGPLIDKLLGLSQLQQLALRDLVERYWYVGASEYPSMGEYLKANGIAA